MTPARKKAEEEAREIVDIWSLDKFLGNRPNKVVIEKIYSRVADALEARDRKIEELEEKLEVESTALDGALKQFEEASDENQTLESQLANLREALEPFANDYFSNPEDCELNCKHLMHQDKDAYDACVYFEDVKRAKAALAKTEGK